MHIPPNWGIFLALIVSFLVFWFIFSRLFFRPFLALLSERENRIKSLNDRAEKISSDAKAADEQAEHAIAQVWREALERRENERRRIETETTQMIEAAKADARASLEAAQARVESEVKAAESELDRMGRALASELAERLMGRPLNGAGNRQ